METAIFANTSYVASIYGRYAIVCANSYKSTIYVVLSLNDGRIRPLSGRHQILFAVR